MIDRLAALADIVPPAPAVAPPPLPWWSGPWGAALIVGVGLALLGSLWVLWRSRRVFRALVALRRLRRNALKMRPGDESLSFVVSTAVANVRGAGVRIEDLPHTVRNELDALRYQRPGADDPAPAAMFLALRMALRWHAWRQALFWRQPRAPTPYAARAARPEGAALARSQSRSPQKWVGQ